MNEERRMILQMVEDGTITADQAAELLRALGEAAEDAEPAGTGAAFAEDEDEAAGDEGLGARHRYRKKPPRFSDPLDIAAWAEEFAEHWARRGERLAEAGERIAERAARRAERLGERIGAEVEERLEAMPSHGIVVLPGIHLFGPRVKDVVEWTHEAEGEGPIGLDVETRNGRVEVTGTDRDDILVRLERSAQAATREQADELLKDLGSVEWRDGTLVVDPGPRRDVWTWWGGRSLRVIVELPRSRAVRGQAVTKNGRVVFESLEVPEGETLLARTANGRIEVRDVRGGTVEATTHNGRLVLENVDASVRASTSNGSVRWSLDAASADRTVRLSTLNGSVKAMAPLSGGLSVEGHSKAGSVRSHLDEFRVEGRYGHRSLRGIREGRPMVELRLSTHHGSITLGGVDGDGGEGDRDGDGAGNGDDE